MMTLKGETFQLEPLSVHLRVRDGAAVKMIFVSDRELLKNIKLDEVSGGSLFSSKNNILLNQVCPVVHVQRDMKTYPFKRFPS